MSSRDARREQHGGDIGKRHGYHTRSWFEPADTVDTSMIASFELYLRAEPCRVAGSRTVRVSCGFGMGWLRGLLE